jgi:alpha-L-glutamate ligase-like protein
VIDAVLGINRRNVDYINRLNAREHFVLVDDKLAAKRILGEQGFPTPRLLAAAESVIEMPGLVATLSRNDTFALKPARGSGGAGIVIVKGRTGGRWDAAGGERWGLDEFRAHVNEILYGVYAVDNTIDSAFAEELVTPHPCFASLTDAGVPDIRVLVYRGRPAVAMTRIPTSRSKGKANLHSGGFAVGIELASGRTTRGSYRGRPITAHPESRAPLRGIRIPGWNTILDISSRLFQHFPLGLMGVDFAIDAHHGPLVLELNARPGLEIQNVTGIGLRALLESEKEE